MRFLKDWCVTAMTVLLVSLSGCAGGLLETWEGPGAKVFRPQSIAALPPMASQYDNAREDIQEVLAVSLVKAGRIERVVHAEQVADIFQSSKEAFDTLVFYFSRLEMTGQSDRETAIKLGKAMNVEAFLVLRINAWEYAGKAGNNVGRVGLTLRLVDATTGATIWKARHEKSSGYIFNRPNLKEVAAELTDEMVKYMPPTAIGQKR